MRYAIKVAVVVVITGAVLAGAVWVFNSGRDVVAKIATLISEQRQLRDGWVQAQVQLRDQAMMLQRVAEADACIEKSLAKSITAIGELRAELSEIRGGGAGQPAGPDVRRFEDSLITIEYQLRRDLFDYRLHRLPVDLVFYRPASGKWAARFADSSGAASRLFKINSFRVDEREPSTPWWKKVQLGIGGGYLETPFLQGSVGYGHHHLQPMLGVDRELEKRVGGAYLYTF